MEEPLLFAVAEGVATITFNRPGKRNAVTQAMWHRFAALVTQAEADPDVGLVLVTGAGDCFVSGADLDEYASIHVSREASIAYLDTTSRAFSALADCAKPTVARITGPCMGGGCMIALACDLRFASDTARFCLPPSRLGLIFPLANTKRIVDILGPAAAKDLLFSARVVEADEALRIGLVNEVHSADMLAARTEARIRQMLGNAPSSLRRMKQVIARVLAGASEDDTETRGWLVDALAGEDYREGRLAFEERRKPRFRFSRAADGA
jgi:enoyl-CoA hydratase/carnithine racemase